MEIADGKERKKVKRKSRNSHRKATQKISATDYILAIILLLEIVVTLYPLLIGVALSLNNNLLIEFKNSVLRTLIGTVFSTFVCALFAYILSKKDFIFRRELTVMLVVTMYVSGGLIPSYMINRQLGFVNSFWVYIIPT